MKTYKQIKILKQVKRKQVKLLNFINFESKKKFTKSFIFRTVVFVLELILLKIVPQI